MTKSILLGAALLAGQICFAQSKKEVTEVAIYRIEETKNQNFTSRLTDFRNQVSQLSGYKDYLTLKDKNSQCIYIDILHWKNLDDALAASEAVKNGKQYESFTKAIDSLLFYGEMYPFKSFVNSKSKLKMENKVTEVVVYQIKSDKVQEYSDIAILHGG